MKHNFFLVIFITFLYNNLKAQIDSIYIFDLQSRQYSFIPQLFSDTVNNEGVTSSFSGSLGNIQELPQNLPLNNFIPETTFTNYFPASDSIDINSYPARTNVKIRRYFNGNSIDSTLSGTIISPNKVLTMLSLHNSNLPEETDSILIFPLNGIPQTNPLTSYKVNKIIFKNSTLNSFHLLAILQLDIPIGNELGWVGCGFYSSDSTILSKLYYKFSFPDSLQINDLPNNGDTLMLNYGSMGFSNSNLGILRLNSGFLDSGMGGSSLIYKNENDYLAIGVSTFGSRYGHRTFTKRDFYLYKEIIENTTLSIFELEQELFDIICFPSPSSDQITVKSTGDLKINQVSIFDISGKLVYKIDNIPLNEIKVDISFLNQGIYIIQANTYIGKSKFFKISVIK